MGDLSIWNNVTIICFAFICLIGTLGNIMVIVAFKFIKVDHFGKKSLPFTPMDQCIVNLAVIDLLTSLINPAMYIYDHSVNYKDWMFGEAMCKIFKSLPAVLDTMSFGMILVITIERCIVLCFPFRKKMHSKEIHVALILVIVISVLNELPVITHIRVYRFIEGTLSCHSNNNNTQGIGTQEILQKQFSSEESCDSYLATRVNSSSCNVTTCSSFKYCQPEESHVYKSWRLGTLLLRDLVFLIVFMSSIAMIYRALSEQESVLKSESNIHPKKHVTFLLTLAIIFCCLVYPKDLFHISYLTQQLLKKKLLPKDILFHINSSLKILQSCNSIVNIFIYAKLHKTFLVRCKEVPKKISLSTNNYLVLRKGVRFSYFDSLKETTL